MPSQYPAFSSKIVYTGVTAKPVPASQNNTDVLSVKVKLYIEGVQVPFVAISISQVYNSLPSASVELPPSSSLMEILRGYQPKVHIFYEDLNTGGMRLLFWGHLSDVSYSKSRLGGGSSSISFSCTHKNSVFDRCTMDYAGWANQVAENQANPGAATAGAGTLVSNFNSKQTISTALQGIDGIAFDENRLIPGNDKVNENTPTNQLDPDLEIASRRYYGMTGTLINLWNQFKLNGLGARKLENLYISSVWIPLIEEGIGFFKRLSGHYHLESRVQTEKVAYCHTEGGDEKNICVPLSFRNSMLTAYHNETAIEFIHSNMSFSSELVTFPNLYKDYLGACGYDVLTLASPAEVHPEPDDSVEDTSEPTEDGWQSVETIIVPQLPIYFSPLCNVVLPRMWHSLNVTQTDSAVPTRIIARHDALPPSIDTAGFGTSYVGPPSIREAFAYNSLLRGDGNSTKALQLSDTTGYSYSIPGKYELGTGPRPEKIYLPWWLATLYSDKASGGVQAGQETIPQMGTPAYDEMMFSIVDWDTRYSMKVSQDGQTTTLDPTKLTMNPLNPFNGGVQAMQRMLFSSVDYEFSKKFMGTRNGVVEGVFNPYIIPGYPMELIDDSPNNPSFHGFCTSVTHSITARSIGTSVGMSGAISYSELSNYYVPPAPPYLQTALNLVNGTVDAAGRDASDPGARAPYTNVSSTLLQNKPAKETADIHYKQVLGIGAIAPDDLIHFASGRAYPLVRQNAVLYPRMVGGGPDLSYGGPINGRHSDDYYSTVGNLRLVRRQIESQDSISDKFQLNFIDYNTTNYNNDFKNFINPNLTSKRFLEPGASLFLDYLEISDFITKP